MTASNFRPKILAGSIVLITFTIASYVFLGFGADSGATTWITTISQRSKTKKYSNVGFDIDPRWGEPVEWGVLKSQLLRPRNVSLTSTDSTIARLPRKVTKPAKKRGTNRRTFGCLRDGCRGLAIEDLLDRGWSMKFKTSMDNVTKEYKQINYRLTVLLTDTTQLNHMDSVKHDVFRKIIEDYEGASYITAFVGADAIGGNKGQQLRVKSRFASEFHCKYNDLGIQPAQYRLYIKDECEDLYRTAQQNQALTWLLKPEAGSQGQGITFHSDATEIQRKRPEFYPCKSQRLEAPKRALVQEYIEKPLLLKGSKFDVRCYMMIASSEPWLVFYHEGYLRRSLAKYSALSKDRRVYLTNTHFQSMKAGFKLSEHIWTFGMMQDYLKEQKVTGSHYVEAVMNPYIKNIVRYIFHSAKAKIKPRRGSFQILGLDFMIDEMFHLHFIEANGYPGFTWSINFDSRGMVEDHFDLAMELHETPGAFRLMKAGDRYGSWELVHSDIEEKGEGRMYNPCEEMSDNLAMSMPLRYANKKFAKISGTGGSTDLFDNKNLYPETIPGWKFLGGEKGDTLTQRIEFAKSNGCEYWQLQLEPEAFKLYEPQDCKRFFGKYAQDNAESWMLKQVQGSGHGDGIVHIHRAKDLKEDFDKCLKYEPNWIVQKRVPNSLKLQVERIRYPGLRRDALGELASSSNPPVDVPPLEDVVFSQSTKYVRYDIRVYMLVASVEPLMVFYHDGFVRSSRDYLYDGFVGLKLNEHVMSFDQFQYHLAITQRTGAQYVSSVLQPHMFKVMEYVLHSARAAILKELNKAKANRDDSKVGDEDSNVDDNDLKDASISRKIYPSQLFGLNFVLDESFNVHLVGVSGNPKDVGFYSTSENVKDVFTSMKQTRRELVLELAAAPAGFVRMRRGDSYGSYRLIFSEMEQHIHNLKYNPCVSLLSAAKNKRMFVSKEQIKLAASLGNYGQKQFNAHEREMKKYVSKRWDYCKRKSDLKAQANCIRDTLTERYRNYVVKERIPYDPGFVERRIKQYQARRAGGSSSDS